MSTTTVVSRHDNIIDSVAVKLAGSQLDLSNTVVVFPGKRPAHFLRKKLSQIFDNSHIPPKIFSMDTCIEFLATEKLGIQSRVIDALDAVAVLFEIHQEMENTIGGEHFKTMDRFLPLGIKMFGELEELTLADIESKHIKAHVQGIPFGKLNLLAEYYEKFYRELSTRHLTTRAVRYASVAGQMESIELSEFALCIFAGFYLQSPAEKRIFSNLRTRSNIEFIYQRVKGCSVPVDTLQEETRSSDDNENGTTEIRYVKAPDTHGQIFALGALIKEAQERGELLNESCAIVLPAAETLFPLLEEALALLPKDHFNIALGYPLSRTPIYGFINTLIELVASMDKEKIPASAYLAFLLHPYTKNIRYHGKSEMTRVLVHTLEEYLSHDQSKFHFTLEEIESWTPMLDAAVKRLSADGEHIRREDICAHLASIHDHTIRLLLQMNSIGEFARKCIHVLMYIYEESTANLHPLFRRYAEQIIEVFESIESSLMSNAQFKNMAVYGSLLKHYVATQDVPFPGTPLKGVQVLGLLETRNLQFETVFILDVNEGILPPARSEDMLLPQSLRQTLGLETYREREKLVEYYFQQLLQRAKKVHLFFTETHSGEKERSRFIHKLLWKKERELGVLLEDRTVSSVHYHIKLANEQPLSLEKTHETVQYLDQMEYSATKLDTYLHCPLQFYYRYVLRLDERETLSEELDQRDAGEIVHAILRELFLPYMGRTLTQADIAAIPFEEFVIKEFQLRFGKELTGDQHLMCVQVMHQVSRFLHNYQVPLVKREDVTILGIETDMRVIENGIILRARCDRIERRKDSVYIIDYKISGSDARFKIDWSKLALDNRSLWSDTIGSLQLAFYMLVYQIHQSSQQKDLVPIYLLLGKNTISSEIEVPLFAENDTRIDRYTLLKKIINLLIHEIQNPSAEFSPPRDLTTVCPNCPFTTVCGTAWVRGHNSNTHN
jgi:ATP-dependent helicase/nuclease subunit B